MHHDFRIFNEWYAVQTSKKVRAVWAMKAANGKRSNFRVPYGYKRDELDKEKWLVDEAAVICTPNTGHPVLGVLLYEIQL